MIDESSKRFYRDVTSIADKYNIKYSKDSEFEFELEKLQDSEYYPLN